MPNSLTRKPTQSVTAQVNDVEQSVCDYPNYIIKRIDDYSITFTECVCVRARARECVYMCACVSVRERERERT